MIKKGDTIRLVVSQRGAEATWADDVLERLPEYDHTESRTFVAKVAWVTDSEGIWVESAKRRRPKEVTAKMRAPWWRERISGWLARESGCGAVAVGDDAPTRVGACDGRGADLPRVHESPRATVLETT